MRENVTAYLKSIIDICFRDALEEASITAAKDIAARIEEKFKQREVIFSKDEFNRAGLVHLRLDHNFDECLGSLNKRVSELELENSEQASLLRGECPECGRQIRGWRAPTGSFAPEAWETLREEGIHPPSGHKTNCSRSDLVIS